MSRHKGRREARRRDGRVLRWALLVAIIVAMAATATLWLRPAPKAATAGTPRLVVDRTEVDLGYRHFDTPVRVVFTLTNAGDSALRLTGTPRVEVVAGC